MEDPKLERHTAHSAFVLSLALAVGDEVTAQRFLRSMLRAHLLARPLDVEAYEASRGDS